MSRSDRRLRRLDTDCVPRGPVLAALGPLVVVVALLAQPAGAAQAADSVRVEVWVWQHAGDAGDIRVGARPADGSWPAPEMLPLALDGRVSPSGRYRYGDIAIEVEWRVGEAPLTVEVRVWQHVEDERDIRISARGSLGSWDTLGTVPLALDALDGPDGCCRAGSVTIEAPLPQTITTLLYPGWNMVAWLGPQTPVADLFEEIPSLQRVSAWDTAEQRYRRSTRSSVPPGGLDELDHGMGLWLRMDGDGTFEWTRLASQTSVLHSLRAGRNLVGWGGRDDTGVGEALARFGGLLEGASRWNGEEQAWERYRPGASNATSALAELNHGDALWVELSGDARWWQSGRIPEPVVFLGEVTEDRQQTIREWAEGAVAFFAERWGVEAAFSSFVGDIESVTPKYIDVRGFPPGESLCADYAAGVMLGVIDCVSAGTYPHEYFHGLQSALREYREVFIPQWLIEGTAEWADGLYVGLMSSDLTLAEHLDQRRNDATSAMVVNDTALADMETNLDFYAHGWYGYHKGFAATDWLVERSSEVAVIDFFARLAGEGTWPEAFESAFGISAASFYEEFEGYVARVAPPLAHLTDDSEEPVLVFLGEIPLGTEGSIRERLTTIEELFGERLRAGSADYTVYVGASAEPLADVYRLLAGSEIQEDFCSIASRAYFVTTLDCLGSQFSALVTQHSRNVRERLAPWGSLPRAEDSYDRRGPHWLPLAIEAYVEHAYLRATEPVAFDGVQAREHWLARRAQQSLDDLSTSAGLSGARSVVARALSLLAGELLAERAGEAALFDYYRMLPASETWEAAFEAVFGMSVADFHAEFEAYRADVAPPYVLYRIRGVVLDPAGNPAVGVWVAANRGEGRWEDTATTGPEGAFELAVRHGSYDLAIDPTWSACSVPTDDRLHPGGMTEVDGTDVIGVEIRLPDGSVCTQS